MAISEVPVADSFQGQFGRCMKVLPVRVADADGRPTSEQKRHRDTGLPLWQISVPVDTGEDERPDVVHVKVGEATKPEMFDERVYFVGLKALQWSMGERGGMAFSADAVEVAGQPVSSGRAAVGAPAKPPAPKAPKA